MYCGASTSALIGRGVALAATCPRIPYLPPRCGSPRYGSPTSSPGPGSEGFPIQPLRGLHPLGAMLYRHSWAQGLAPAAIDSVTGDGPPLNLNSLAFTRHVPHPVVCGLPGGCSSEAPGLRQANEQHEVRLQRIYPMIARLSADCASLPAARCAAAPTPSFLPPG